MQAAERVLRYLGHTKHYAIVFDGETPDPRQIFIALSDSAYADNVKIRYSSQRYYFKLFNGIVD